MDLPAGVPVLWPCLQEFSRRGASLVHLLKENQSRPLIVEPRVDDRTRNLSLSAFENRSLQNLKCMFGPVKVEAGTAGRYYGN